MAEQVDGIEYYVDMETGNLVIAQKDVDKATAAMKKGFKGLDTEVSKASKGVNAGMQSMSRNAGQAGIQFQQFFGQVQAGTPVMTALSQQGADLGIVLGAPLAGVILSLGAILAGTLAPALFESSDAAEELVDKLKELKKETILSEAQYKVLIKAENDSIESTKELIAEKEREIERTKAAISQGEQLRAQYEREAQGGKLRQQVLNQYTKEIEDNTDKLNQQVAELELYNTSLDDSTKKIETYSALISGATGQTEKQRESVIQLIATTKQQADTFGKSAREIAIYSAQLNGATKVQLDAINRNFDTIESKKAEADARKENERALRAELAAEESSRRSAQSFAGRVTKAGQTESERLEADMAKLESLREQSLLTTQEYEEAKTSIEVQQAELRNKAREKEASVAQGTMEAQLSVASSLLSSLQGVTTGILATLDEQSSGYKIAFAIQKAAAIAQTIVAAELAAAQVLAHDAGILGLGAVATSNLVRGLGYASAGVIAGTAVAGGRESGGPVMGNRLYEVGEKNKPEVFQAGGRQYMIPGNNGKVISNSDLHGGGQGVTVNNTIVAPPGMTADISSNTSSDGMTVDQVIKIMEAQTANPGSKVNQNIRQTNTTSARQPATRRA